VQAMVNEGLVSLSHAKVLAGLELKEQGRLAVDVAAGKLTVRALERRAASLRDKTLVFRPGKPSDWTALERRLSDHLGYPVTVQAEKSGKGELKVRFHSLDELDGLLSRIGYRES
jgi:ParB family chromosome partitioning protein